MTEAIIRTGSREEMIRFVVDYAALARKTPDREVLSALVVDHLPATDVNPTLALLGQMTDADVAEVFDRTGAEARGAYAPLVLVLDLLIFACNEDVPYNSIDGMKAVVDGLKFKFLAKSGNVDPTLYDICPLLPPGKLPIPNFHDAVTSDIPTLVMYGFNDTQTGTAQALLAASTLSHSTALGFPEAGHGALIFSQCAKDIGTAFVERPGEPLNTACINRLKPQWVLPPPG